jgi:biotin transporter BioY
MTQQTSKAQIGPLSVIIFFIIIAMTVNYFIEGGIEPLNIWTTWSGYLFPFGFLVIVLSLLRTEITSLINQSKGWIYSIVTLLSYVVFLYLAYNPDSFDGLYLILHDSTYNAGNIATSSIIGLAFLTAFFRVFLARSKLTLMLIALSFLSFMLWTPLGDMIWPTLTQVGEWVHINISAAGEGGYRIARTLGTIAIIVRVLTFRQKLRPT